MIKCRKLSAFSTEECLAAQTGFPFWHFDACPSVSADGEGLCILSRYPFLSKTSFMQNAHAITGSVEINGHCMCILNLHLPWDSVLEREREIVCILDAVQNQPGDYYLIAGDFNSSPCSSIQAYLLGEQSLYQAEANPCWFDLAESFAERTGTLPQPTLDIRHNPRWHGENTIEIANDSMGFSCAIPIPARFPS